MSKKNEIINNFKELILHLKKHNKYYYADDSPRISDSEYDLLKKKILKLEKQFPYLKQVEDVSSIVGAKPSNKFKKIKHIIPMLSLSNDFDKNNMEDFIK